MRLTKFSQLTPITLFLLAAIVSLLLSVQSPPTNAVVKAKVLAFFALQQQGSDDKTGLYTIQANGSARHKLSQNLDVIYTMVWSPNGQRIAYSGDTDIYVVNADGSRLTKLFSGDPCKASSFGIVWLSNNKLVFTRSCDGSTYDTPGSQSLYISDTTGSQGTKQIQSWQVGGIPPKTETSSELYLSPTGQQVAFVKDQNIYKMNTDGSGLTNLTNKPGDYVSGGSRLVWSPDGNRIAFLYGQYPKQQIYLIDADGKNLRNLTNNPENRVFNTGLFWSPDSTDIAYYHDQPGDRDGKQQDIYLLNVSKGTSKNLTQKPELYDALSWSPNSKFLAFVSGDFSHQELYTINVDGSKLTKLTSQLTVSRVDDLAWSSDSQFLAFTSNQKQAGKRSLYVVRRVGSGLTKLTNDQDLDAHTPTWQP